jgi:hypothetical protein
VSDSISAMSLVCPHLEKCPFFNGHFKHMPAVAEMAKNSYCRSDQHEGCARFIVSRAVGPERVPSDLFPDQTERVADLVAGEKSPGS